MNALEIEIYELKRKLIKLEQQNVRNKNFPKFYESFEVFSLCECCSRIGCCKSFNQDNKSVLKFIVFECNEFVE